MLNQNGGIIGPANIPTTTSAKGKWSLAEYYLAKRQNIWPSVTPNNDPYYPYTTLLLPGNGTNGAQNNTFLDGSTNNFTITRNGNTTQGTFSPFSQTGWGNYFGGSGNYLKVADGTALDLPGDFTLEGWFYFSSLSSNNGIIGYGSEAASQNGFSLYWAASSVNKLRIWSNGAALLTGTTTLSANTWNHIAIVRSGSGSNNLTVYVNGAVDQTATNTTSFTGVAALGMGIGVNYDGTFYNPFTGYASNIRLVKGQALATGAFTPPTSPVSTSSVGWTGANAAASLTGTVSVLTCQSNRFVDNSSSPLAITVTGSPSVQAFSPFNPSASWSAATYGGSGYFDGTGDYLTAPSNSVYNFSGDFTIEAWVYLTSNPNTGMIIDTRNGDVLGAWAFSINATQKLDFLLASSGTTRITSTNNVSLNAWTHVVVSRASGTLRLFINGNQEASTSTSAAINALSSPSIGGGRASGTNVVNGYYLNGYISGLRVLNGTGYSTITVPTAPFTNDVNTSLLLNFTNAGIYDATSKNDLETVGNAQISNAITPQFGSTSIKFDGTGNYLYKPYDQLLNQLNGNFTIECWIYPTVTNTQMYFAGSANSSGSDNWLFGVTSSNKLYFNWANTTSTGFAATSTASISQNVWTYVAAVKSGGTITLYINGSADGTSSPTGTYRNASFPFAVGRPGDYNGIYFTGYIQDFRMTTYARTITASPTAAFPTL